MTLQLSDIQSGAAVELWNAQELADEREGSVDASPPVGFDSDEAYLTSLEQQGQATIQGGATALRISRQPEYSSDPRTALAEWVARFDAYLNGAPGEGYELIQGYRDDRTFQGYVDSLSWTVRGGEPLEVGFSLSFQRGQGVSVYSPPRPADVTVTDTWSVAGQTFASVDEFQSSKQLPVNVARRTFADSPDDNDLSTDGGVTRELTLTGRIVGTASERNTFVADLTDTLGNDELVNVEEGLTGQTFEGMLSAVSNSDEAGRSRDSDVSVTVIEGTE